jgi:hypothetical protein
MRSSDWTPSIVPSGDHQDVCLVVDDFGRRGRAYCETDVEATDLETVIQGCLAATAYVAAALTSGSQFRQKRLSL